MECILWITTMNTFIIIHTCIYIYEHIVGYTDMIGDIYIYMDICMCIYIYICICMCIYICMYIYMDIPM